MHLKMETVEKKISFSFGKNGGNQFFSTHLKCAHFSILLKFIRLNNTHKTKFKYRKNKNENQTIETISSFF